MLRNRDGQRPPNRLLARLTPQDWERFRSHLEPVTLTYRLPIYGAHEPIPFVHFIETGVASAVNTMVNGQTAEVGTIGNEGFIGLPVLLGDDEGPTAVYVQVPGTGLRMVASTFRDQVGRSESLRTLMLRYAHAFVNHVAQSAACVHFHALEQRCCQWLLMTHDRMAADEFLLTHEFFAMMLGVRRAGVSEAAAALQRAGLIRYARGHVTVLDRIGLEDRSCECYAVTRAQFDRLLGPAPPRKATP